MPDEIQYPVPNDEYDPVLARRASGGAGEAQEVEGEKRRLEDEIRQQEGMLKEAQDAQTQLKQQLDAPGLEEPAKNRLNRDKARRDRDVERITAEINNRKTRLAALTAPPGAVDAKFLKPYKLETFKVTVDPGVTRLCTNFSEYTNLFGPFSADQDRNPGEALAPGHRALTHAVYGFFKNGGTRCFVARVKSDNAEEIDRALTAFGSIDAVAIVAAPGLTEKAIWASSSRIARIVKTVLRFWRAVSMTRRQAVIWMSRYSVMTPRIMSYRTATRMLHFIFLGLRSWIQLSNCKT